MRVPLAFGNAPRRPPGERACELDLGVGGRERMRDRLVGADSPAELLPLRDVRDAELERPRADTDRLEGEDRERTRAVGGEDLRRAELPPGVATRDDAEGPRL